MQAMILTIFNMEESEKNLTGVTMWWETSRHRRAIDQTPTVTKEVDINKFMYTTDIAKTSSYSIVFFIFDSEKKVTIILNILRELL